MKVKELMRREVATCGREATLADAARMMGERHCGVVPVTEGDGRLCGVVTDRDLCMAAYRHGKSLAQLHLAAVMSPSVHTLREDDDLSKAHQVMRKQHVRRLPVLDGQGHLAGILSLDDLASASEDSRSSEEVTRTLGAIMRHRSRDL
jgi:CBS domain-containing protein